MARGERRPHAHVRNECNLYRFKHANFLVRTNTKTTDVELMEKRYPILIREFSIRQGSGGKGRFNGGCGIVRDFECRLPLTFSMISERRVNRPFGMFGGEDAECGKNFWVKKNPNPEDASWTERWVDLGPRGQVDLDTGDRFVVHTPGGGGWGVPEKVNGVNGEVNGENHADTTTFYPRATGTYHIYSEAQAQSS
jgi:5-oxoprolinase (ATP-hydrolysing)